MNPEALYDGLLNYLYLVIIVTFHEFGHAWTANRLGDDTARLQGRITLNPASHIDPIGTILLPLLVVVLGAFGEHHLSGFIIGWGRSVPFNPGRLRNRRLHIPLIALAGPIMNVILATAVIGLSWIGVVTGASQVREVLFTLAMLSLYLCFFNLLPIPPLDGSHIARGIIGFSEEVYAQLCRYGLFLVIVALQIPYVQFVLGWLTAGTFLLLTKVFALSV